MSFTENTFYISSLRRRSLICIWKLHIRNRKHISRGQIFNGTFTHRLRSRGRCNHNLLVLIHPSLVARQWHTLCLTCGNVNGPLLIVVLKKTIHCIAYGIINYTIRNWCSHIKTRHSTQWAMLHISAYGVIHSSYVATVNIPWNVAMLWRGRNIGTLVAMASNTFLVN